MLKTTDIIKPSINLDHPNPILASLYGNRSDSRIPFKIALTSQKGGVAKTTSCISLGAGLAELGRCVLLVDLDPQGHLTQAIGIELEKVRRSTSDILLNQASLLSATRESGIPNLDILPADTSLLLVDKLLFKTEAYEFRLKAQLEEMNSDLYDCILFDCPPTFSPLTMNALATTDLAIIPITCDYYSANSLIRYLELLDLVKEKINPEIDYRILVTLFESRTRISHLLLEQYRSVYKEKLFETHISMDVKIRESAVFGKPVTKYSKNSRSANEYRALARELVEWQKMMH